MSVCHGLGLAHAARRLLPDYEVHELPVWHLRTLEQRQAAMQHLRTLDHVFVVPLGSQFGAFAAEQVMTGLPRALLFPPFVFFGFHPDMTSMPDPYRVQFPAPIADYHSKLVMAGFLAGCTVDETLGLFNPLVFGKLGYFDAYDQEVAAACALFRAYQLDIVSYVARWRQHGRFVHTPNHPLPFVLADLMRLALARAGIPFDPAVDLDDLPDELAGRSNVPVYPAIAARLGVSGSLSFTAVPSTRGDPARVLSAAEFVDTCFRIYAQAPPAALLGAPGVARAQNLLVH